MTMMMIMLRERREKRSAAKHETQLGRRDEIICRAMNMEMKGNFLIIIIIRERVLIYNDLNLPLFHDNSLDGRITRARDC